MADEAVSEFTAANIPLLTIGELDSATGKGDGTTEEPDFSPPGSEGTDDALVLVAPTLISPPDGYQAPFEDTIRFRWQGVDNASKYVVQFSASYDFRAVATSQSETTDTFVDNSEFSRDITYYWRVMAVNEDTSTYSPWSEVFSFGVMVEEEPQPPGPNPTNEEPTIDDEAPDEFDNPLTIVKITATPNPVAISAACALDVEVESKYGGVEYVWSIISGDGSLANGTTKTPTYTASAHRDVVGIRVIATDDQSNTATASIVVFVDNTWSSIIATDGIQTGCTVDVSTVDPAGLAAPGWGADGTSSAPGGSFPTHGSRYSSGCELDSDLGALIFFREASTDWFRYYVSGYKVKLLYPMSKRSGKMSVNIQRYDPRVDSVTTVGTTIIDQSATVVDGDGNDCWELGIKEIRLGIVGSTTDDDEWDYDASDGSLDRYIYRLNFEFDSSDGEFTDQDAYGNPFVGLIGMFVYREERDVIFVDTDAEWNAGTLGGCTVADDTLTGEDDAGTPVPSDERLGSEFTSGSGALGEATPADAWAAYLADPDTIAGGPEATMGQYLNYNGSWTTYGAWHIQYFMKLPIPATLPDTPLTLRFWFTFSTGTSMGTQDRWQHVRLQLRSYDYSGGGVTTTPFLGTLVDSVPLSSMVTDLNAGPNGEDHYIDFEVNGSFINAAKDGSDDWRVNIVLGSMKTESWWDLVDVSPPATDTEFIQLTNYKVPATDDHLIIMAMPALYTSEIFNFAYVYDFEDLINWSSNNRYFDNKSDAGVLIEWRAGMQANLSDGTWGSMHEAFAEREIQYAQFRITFRTDGHIHKLYLLLKEGRPR